MTYNNNNDDNNNNNNKKAPERRGGPTGWPDGSMRKMGAEMKQSQGYL